MYEKFDNEEKKDNNNLLTVDSTQLKRRQQKSFQYALQSQISEKLENSDIRSTLQLLELQQACIDDQIKLKNPYAVKCQRIYDRIQIPKKIITVLVIILMFFEKPSWCTDKHSDDCRYLKSENFIHIPRSQFPILDIYIFYPIEMGIFLFFWYCIYLKKQCIKPTKEVVFDNRVCGILISLILINDIIRMALPNLQVNIGLLVKPAFLLYYNQNLRNNTNLYKIIVSKGIPIILAMLINMMIFAGIGRIIFAEVPDEVNYFNDFWETMFNLLVCQSTSNFPDVMMDFYTRHQWAPYLYIIYMIINTYILLNMILAVFYASYRDALESRTKYFYQNNNRQLYKFVSKVMNDTGETVESMLSEHALEKIIHMIAEKTKRQHLIDLEIRKRTMSQNFLNFQAFQHHFQQNPRLSNFLKHIATSIVLGLAYLANFIYNYFNAEHVAQKQKLEQIAIVNLCFNSLFLADDIVRLVIFKLKYFREHIWYIYDLLLSIVTLVLIFVYAFGYGLNKLPFYVVLLSVTRFYRFFRLILKITYIKVIYMSLVEFFPYIKTIFFTLGLMFFFFYGLGNHIFGGHLNESQRHKLEDTKLPGDYIYNNFNDAQSGIILLFELIVVNNWMVNAAVHVTVMNNNHFYRIFFIIWYFFGVILAVNIVVAFIIDFLVNQWNEKQEQEQEIQHKLQSQTNPSYLGSILDRTNSAISDFQPRNYVPSFDQK